MSSTAPASAFSPSASSRIDEQLRLRIAEDLSGGFKGDIIGPDHADYERARLVWNAMIDRRPGLILRCTSTADVVAAVTVARLLHRRRRRGPGSRRGHHPPWVVPVEASGPYRRRYQWSHAGI